MGDEVMRWLGFVAGWWLVYRAGGVVFSLDDGYANNNACLLLLLPSF